ncbi:MAG: DUF4232 domain-containing protein [Candidatus Dormibacteria bacterium]
MKTPDPTETRIRQALGRLMQVEPPRREATPTERPHHLRTLAVALTALVTMSAAITGGLVVLRHSSSGGPPKPTPAVIAPPFPGTINTPIPVSPTAVSAYLPASGPPCSASQLELRLGQQGGAGGNGYTYLIFTDRGTAPCVLRGTPTVTLLGGDGRPLTVPSVTESPSGMFKTLANDGVGLVPLTDQGTAPGRLPEGGQRGQAALPLQYPRDGCANSVATVSVELGGGRLTVPLTLPGAVSNCQVTLVEVNPFQPAEYEP